MSDNAIPSPFHFGPESTDEVREQIRQLLCADTLVVFFTKKETKTGEFFSYGNCPHDMLAIAARLIEISLDAMGPCDKDDDMKNNEA